MRRVMLKSKIHRATVTAASIDYEGSITIDSELMDAALIYEYEQVHVLDITNGRRLITYAIPGGPGEICINGAAARLVDIGDQVIILSYAGLVPKEWPEHRPAIVKVDESNQVTEVSRARGAAWRKDAKAAGHTHSHGHSQDQGQEAEDEE